MVKKVSIIVIGNSHDDFVPYPILISLFEKLHHYKIPSAFMEEIPFDQDLSVAYKTTKMGIDGACLMRGIAPEIKGFYCKDEKTSCTYLPRSAVDPLNTIYKKKIMPAIGLDPEDKSLISQFILDLFREKAYIEQLKLYDKIKELNIYLALLNFEWVRAFHKGSIVGKYCLL